MSTLSALARTASVALGLALIALITTAPLAASASNSSRIPSSGKAKPISNAKLFGTRSSQTVLRVKLHDGAGEAQLDAYATKIGAKVTDVFQASKPTLNSERSQAESRSHKSLTDLSQYKRLVLPRGKTVQNVIGSVDALPDVQFSYSEALPAPPPSASFTSQQLYRNAAPAGIGAGYLAKVPGATGGPKIVDVEYGWDLTHEDLSKARAAGAYITSSANPMDPFSYPNHGTAVLGELVADANSFGVTGITPNSPIDMVTTYDAYTGTNIANAVNVAHQHMTTGDIMLVEQQVQGPNNGNYLPVEWDPATYDAIVSATADGIIVVEAAANGGENLDNPIYGAPFPLGKPDSGAIIVGAAGSGGQVAGCQEPFSAARSRLAFSDYGTRVNLQGWGECVTTTEGNMALTPSAPLNQSYTNDFDGTSSAAPMIASAAAAISGSSKQIYGTPLSAVRIRTLLEQTGTPQVYTSTTMGQNIGPMPNLPAAFESLTSPSLFSDNFSSGALNNWTAGSGVSIESTQALSAPYAAQAKSTGKAAYESKTIAGQADVYLRSKIFVSQASTPTVLLSMSNSNGNRVAYVYRTQAGYLAVHNGLANKSAVSTTKLPASSWHDIQLHVHVGSSPVIEVWLDGVKISTLHLTISTGTALITKAQIGDQTTGRSFSVDYDDIGVSKYYIAP